MFPAVSGAVAAHGPTVAPELVIQTLTVLMTLVVLVGTIGIIALYRMAGRACPDPSVHPQPEKKPDPDPYWVSRVGGDEECKLHSRRLSECIKLGYHKKEDE